jgi:transglutaminase-like putative cysteine protease
MGAISMSIIAADKALATAQISPPELLIQTLVRPDRKIADARSLTQSEFVLKISEGKMPALPQTAVQAVERIDDQSVRVKVNMQHPRIDPPATVPPLLNTPAADGTDEKIKHLAQLATQDLSADNSPPARAEALRRYVHSYITAKDLSVGMASASEVAQTATGDCTEHAVLLAAMLRADGIPARVASGLLYVDGFMNQSNVFGYHMWTQAWLGGRWVDLDATLNQPFDATHIALSLSDMKAGEFINDMAVEAPLIGRLSIQVIKP